MILKLTFLIASVISSIFAVFEIFASVCLTTPGPLIPTFSTTSGFSTPWNAPAINGLSGTAFVNTTNFAAANPSLSFESSAKSFTVFPIIFTASKLIPDFVEPTFTDEQTLSVSERAFGMLFIRLISPFVKPLSTRAENPPIKSIPISFAALSRAFAKIV